MPEETTKKRKICVIDDEPYISEIYATKFNRAGYDVVTAKDGEEGLELIKQEKPDMILLDIMMPKKDGIAVLKDLEKDEELKKIPVIMLSNLNDEGTIDKVGAYTTRFYVVKSSATPQKILDLVEEVLH